LKPSFVFILADDLGYADLGCYGGRAACSPNLDRMAAEGLRFTEGYSNSPVCSPTRFALATGRWQYRLRGAADEPIASRSARGNPALGLPPEHPTLASLLRDAGYATALVGKWHLGFPPHFGPLKSGYMEFFGPMSGGVDYFTHCDSGGRHDLYEGDREVHRAGYMTDLLTDEAVAFLRRRKKGEPFLLSLHYTAPHWPWEAREDRAEAGTIRSISHLDGGSIETYRTMIRQMDEGIGRVLAELDGNTLVVFTSDNGGERFSDNWPLTGGKMDLLEGGIRVPYIARWPARIPAGGSTAQLAITMDWVATFLEAAGVPPHPDYPLDGISLLRVTQSASVCVERELFWRMKFRQQKAVRSGRWKWLSLEGNEFLYDLARDPRERANRAGREPERFAALRARYEAWEKTVPPIPPDALVSLIGAPAELAKPS
jgi:arylsulfatase A-like enzyme